MKSVVMSVLSVGLAGLLLSSLVLANENTLVYPPLPNTAQGQQPAEPMNTPVNSVQTQAQFPPLPQAGHMPYQGTQQSGMPQASRAPQWPSRLQQQQQTQPQMAQRQYQYPPQQNYTYPPSQQTRGNPYAYPQQQPAYNPYAYYGGNAHNPYAQANRGSHYTYPQPQSGYYGYGTPAPVYGYNNQYAYRRPMPPPEPQPRRYWPDFYTDFTADAWDLMLMGPHDMGVMPGGWQFPSVSMPEPVGVTDAVASQLPIIAEEAPDMFEFSAPTFDFFN